MKRQLIEEEVKLTKNSIKRIDKEKTDLENNLDYNIALIKKQEYLRNFDNIWRNYLQEQKDVEDQEILKKMKELIKMKEELLIELNKQITDGVEKPSGIE